MSIRKKIENNALIFFLGAIIGGFSAGFGAYKAILEIAKFDVVQEGSYVLKKDFTNFYVEWDKTREGYVLKKSNDLLLEQLSTDEILVLQDIDKQTRKLIYSRFDKLKSQALDELDKRITSIVKSYLGKFLLQDLSRFEIEDIIKNEINNWMIAVFHLIDESRDELIESIEQQEKEALNKLKEESARWVPPRHINLANLNLRERRRELALTNFDNYRAEIKAFIKERWIPLFIKKIFKKNDKLNKVLQEAKQKKQPKKVFILFEDIIKVINSEYYELIGPINESQRKVIESIDVPFFQLITGEISVYKYTNDIDILLKEAQIDGTERIKEKMKKILEF